MHRAVAALGLASSGRPGRRAFPIDSSQCLQFQRTRHCRNEGATWTTRSRPAAALATMSTSHCRSLGFRLPSGAPEERRFPLLIDQAFIMDFKGRTRAKPIVLTGTWPNPCGCYRDDEDIALSQPWAWRPQDALAAGLFPSIPANASNFKGRATAGMRVPPGRREAGSGDSRLTVCPRC